MWTRDDLQALLLSSKGKGSRSHAGGQGFGRRKNPKDRAVASMKCHSRGSDDHLVANCPWKGAGKGNDGGFAPFVASTEDSNWRTSPAPSLYVGSEPPWNRDEFVLGTPRSAANAFPMQSEIGPPFVL